MAKTIIYTSLDLFCDPTKQLIRFVAMDKSKATSVNLILYLLKYTSSEEFVNFNEKTKANPALGNMLWKTYLFGNIIMNMREKNREIIYSALSDVDQLVASVLMHLPTIHHTYFLNNFVETILQLIDIERSCSFQKVSESCFFFSKYIVHYANSHQLSKFLDTLLFVWGPLPNGKSLWSEYIYNDSDEQVSSRVIELLSCVSLKPGRKKVKELLIHSPTKSNDEVVVRIALNGYEDLVKIMLNYLDRKDVEIVKCLLQKTKIILS